MPEALQRTKAHPVRFARALAGELARATEMAVGPAARVHLEGCNSALLAGDAKGAAEQIARLAVLASRAAAFGAIRRGPSPLYAAAITILGEQGLSTSARAVWRQLRARGIARGDDFELHWFNARGALRTTRYQQFATTLYRHRARIRKKTTARCDNAQMPGGEDCAMLTTNEKDRE